MRRNAGPGRSDAFSGTAEAEQPPIVTNINAAIRPFAYFVEADYSKVFAMGAHLMQSAGAALISARKGGPTGYETKNGDGVLDEGNKHRQSVNRSAMHAGRQGQGNARREDRRKKTHP